MKNMFTIPQTPVQIAPLLNPNEMDAFLLNFPPLSPLSLYPLLSPPNCYIIICTSIRITPTPILLFIFNYILLWISLFPWVRRFSNIIVFIFVLFITSSIITPWVLLRL